MSFPGQGGAVAVLSVSMAPNRSLPIRATPPSLMEAGGFLLVLL